MKTKNLRINQLSTSAYVQYMTYLEAMDSKNVEVYGSFLADDVEMFFNNNPFGQGKEVILQGLGNYWQSFASVEHDLVNIYGTDENYVLEALNHYKRHDGKEATVKAVAFTDLNSDGKVKSVRLYMDTAPVFE
ncbi:nuclear transport factor 2 family protein [Fulvivirga sp. M361]|uniref:nuclear transport factor 2 family protein n=1 Tax=Fulvivirga sp. M361 TaxID=2594266 RepID=UPI00117A6AC3|nr:nuclear transport factor 2 family protein [Fulvivirga sp. M361]TRX59192.1 nuclear transport factor 2 family protein [Fulvivirga sp. M361]